MSLTESFEDVLDDLFARFIMNLPKEEIISPSRLGFQLEQAWWFYDDFFRLENSKLPKLNLKKFSQVLLGRYPEWTAAYQIDVDEAVKEFLKYKAQVPTCGAILLNPSLTMVLMVKGWSSATWTFPKGKIAKDELPEQCAIREVLEEIGFDISSRLDPNDYLQTEIGPQAVRLYLVKNVSEDSSFQTMTRKEISAIKWISMAELSNPNFTNKSYGVQSVVGRLKAFVKKEKKAVGTPQPTPVAVPKKKTKKQQQERQQPVTKSSQTKTDRKLSILTKKVPKQEAAVFKFDTEKILAAFELGWNNKQNGVHVK